MMRFPANGKALRKEGGGMGPTQVSCLLAKETLGSCAVAE
eukprot:CAMPEP_0183430378 /NCGR_PEP_ID=MMETSP0370-20130417/51022_1 /TAXON_ID=268820 /ORGANISM="Peridinium aciculiferum, Strain PAER-2" /LENGTH=39 /DNA_ID= /DNA_START= /DNA_END= /DNA_ORIENTATION=